LNCDFEDGNLDGWASDSNLGSATLLNTTEDAHGGTHSLKVTNREFPWSSPWLDFSSFLANGAGDYRFTAYAKWISGEESHPGDEANQIEPLNLRLMLRNSDLAWIDDETAYCEASVTSTSGWVKFEFTYTFTEEDLGFNLLCFDTNDFPVVTDNL
jgi:hypothetical protein